MTYVKMSASDERERPRNSVRFDSSSEGGLEPSLGVDPSKKGVDEKDQKRAAMNEIENDDLAI